MNLSFAKTTGSKESRMDAFASTCAELGLRNRRTPLPLLDDFGIGFLDQGAEPTEHLAPTVAELLDSRVAVSLP
jgi:hypothetical protein